MEYEYDEFRDPDDMEFKLMQEVSIENEEELYRKADTFDNKGFRFSRNCYLCLKRMDEGSILIQVDRRNSSLYVKGLDVEEGKFFLFAQKYKSRSVNGDMESYYVLDSMREVDEDLLEVSADDVDWRIDGDDLQEINKECYMKALENKRAVEEKEAIEEEKEAKEEALKKQEEEEKWNKESKAKRDNYEIDGKKFIRGGTTIELDRNLSEIFDYSVIQNYRLNHISSLEFLKNYIFENENGSDVQKFKMTEDGKTIEVKLEERNCSIDGVKISKGNILKVFRNVSFDKINETTIKNVNTLGKVRQGFLNNTTIEVEDVSIPVDIQCVNKDLFKLKIQDDEIELGWNKIKEYFNPTISYQNIRFRWSGFKSFMMTEFGKDKEQLFEMIRDHRLLQDI